MELLTAKLPRTHRLILAGDLHLGTIASHRKGWRALLDRVASERGTYLVLMGDMIEAITVDDYRFAADAHDAKLTPLAQAEEMAGDIKPIAKKVLAFLTGNHEMKLHRYGDLTKWMCQLAGVPYGGFACKLSVSNGKPMYKAFLTHGRLSVNSTADDPVRRLSNQRLTLKRRLQQLAGDCAVMACGHSHKLLTLEPEAELYMTDNGQHIQAHYTRGVQHGEYIDPNLRWYANTGSFLKSAVVGATVYSEAAMYAPVQLGYAEVVVEDGVIQRVEEVHLGADDEPGNRP